MGKRAINRELEIIDKGAHYNMVLSVLQYLPDGIIVTGLDGNIIYANKATEELTGYSFNELVGKTPGILNAEESAVEIQKQILSSLQQGKKWQGNLLQRRQDGSTYYAELETFPVYQGEGALVAWGSIQRNISKQRAAEKELRQSQEYSQMLIEQIQDGLLVTSPEGRYIEANNAACKMLGYEYQELLELSMIDSTPPNIVNETKKNFSKLRNNKIFFEEIMILRKDKTIFPVEMNASAMPNGNYIGIIRDITIRKQMEERIKESEEKYRKLVELSPDAIAVHYENEIIFMNKAGAKLFGVECPSEMIGKSLLDFVHPDCRPNVINRIQDVLTYGKSVPLMEHKFVLPDGRTFNGEARGVPIKYQGKQAIQVVIRDISERKQAERTLKEHRDELSSQLIFAKALNNLAEIVIGSKDKNEIIKSMMTIIGENLEDGLIVRLLDSESFIKNPFSADNLLFYPFSHRDNGFYGLTLQRSTRYKKFTKKELEFINFAAKLVEIAIQKNEYLYQRTRALETLGESQEKYRQLCKNSNDIIYSINLDGTLLSLNKAGLKTFGYSPDEVSSITVEKIIHPHHLDRCLDTMSKILLGFSQRDPYQVLSLTKNGREVWIELTARLMKKNGIPVEIQGIARDITQRKEMEETIRKAEQEKDLILSSISELVLYHDTNLNIKWANATAAESCGMGVDELLGKKCYEIWQGSGSPCEGCPVIKTLETGEMHKKEMTSSNGMIWNVKSYPVNDQEGDIIGVVEIAKDITQTKQIEKEMARLERLNLIGEMAASFGHEIRNPMSTVRGFLQMLSGKAECAPFDDYYNLMIEELDRANSIISDYLSLAKGRAIELKIYNLNNIIESLFPLILADAIHNDKSIELQLLDVPDVLIDKKEIHQLILNLVRNGLEAMTKGGVLTLATYIDGEDTVLAVQDRGKGIEPRILNMLGMPFFTTKDNGTGLGLPVCYSIAERHNARIEVNTSQNGTTFAVKFKNPVVS